MKKFNWTIKNLVNESMSNDIGLYSCGFERVQLNKNSGDSMILV
jgi:hypothetical protein